MSAIRTPMSHGCLSIRNAILIIGLLALANLDGTHSTAFAEKPNVLFISVDDLRPDLGCYGFDLPVSPALDELAKRSLVCRNHFVQVPTCGASRYALLTGRCPTSSNCTQGNFVFHRGPSRMSPTQLVGAQSMPELFRNNGYRTICIGKISHTPDGKVFAYDGSGEGNPEVPHAWDELTTPMGDWNRGWGVFFAYSNGRHREDGRGHRDLMEFTAEKDEQLPDGLIASQAISSLKQLKGRKEPFFMGLGFFKPHLPFVAPRGDLEALLEFEIPLPQHRSSLTSTYRHKSGEFYQYDFPFEKRRPLDEKAVEKSRRAYYACVRYIDRQIGRVLNELRKLNLDQSTVVVIWSDHGWNLGDGQLWGKHVLFDRALRSPLIVHVPGMTSPVDSNSLVATTDIYPTLIEICGLERTQTRWQLDGASFAPLMNDPTRSIRDSVISCWNNGVSVRTKSHRLIATRNMSGASDTPWTNIELYATTQPDPVNDLSEQEPEVVATMLDRIPSMEFP